MSDRAVSMATLLARRGWREPLVVAALVAAAFVIAVAPRVRIRTAVHVDEWTHLAYADALVQTHGVDHQDPVFGGGAVGFRPETGFRVLLAQIKLATGLDWQSLFPVLGGALFAAFTLTVYAAGRAIGAGPYPGILALGTPTTLRLLGPAFVAPIAIALSILAALLLVGRFERGRTPWRAPILTGMLLGGLVLVHPPTLLVATPAIVVASAFSGRRSTPARRWSAASCAAIAMAVPLIWFFMLPSPVRAELLGEVGAGAAQGQGLVGDYVHHAGYLRVGLFALALFVVLTRRPSPLVMGLAGAFVAIVVYQRAHEFRLIGFSNFYDRSWLYMDLLLTLIAGIGISRLLGRVARNRAFPQARLLAARTAPIAVALVVSIFAIAARWQERLYVIADPVTVEDLRWIRANLSNIPGTILIDPANAIAAPSIAGRPVYANAAAPRPSPDARISDAYQMLQDAPDPATLEEAEIGIVYGPAWSAAPGLTEVRPGVFVVDGLRPGLVKEQP